MTLAATIADAQIGSSPTTGSDGPARKTKGRRILMFDVNETLLDLAPLKEPFEKAYGRPDALKAWFTTLLQYASVATLTGAYHPFGRLGSPPRKRPPGSTVSAWTPMRSRTSCRAYARCRRTPT